MIGQSISHFTVLEKLGEGGMGVVYKAQDSKLNRSVAMKFLPNHVAATPEELERFVQEAKAAAALNHPNICTIYGIDEFEGKHFIVMEFVDGQTLAEKKGSLTQKQALEIGIQIAEGLAAAHERGIVHRDIKPENIMIGKDGRVQIMDFGLAKLRGASRLTKEGSTVGTAGYMSPEQVQGHEVDHRSDIFSLGVLLFEMLTGQPPFKGVHETAIAYEIVNVDSPPMSSLKPELSPELDAIVLDCLEKEPQERTQAASQVALELKRYRRESSRQRASRITAQRTAQPLSRATPVQQDAPEVAAEVTRTIMGMRPAVAVLVGVLTLLVLVLGMSVGLLLFSEAPQTGPIRSTLRTPRGLVYESGRGGHAVISPDGQYVVFRGLDSARTRQLWVRELRSERPVALPGTRDGEYPFWSFDSRSIGFFAQGKMKRVDISGSPPLTLADAPSGRGGAWGVTGEIVFAPSVQDRNLYLVSASGGVPVQLTHFDSTETGSMVPRFPSFLPDGKHFLFVTMELNEGSSIDREDYRSYVGDLDGRVEPLSVSGVSNMYYGSGHLVYLRKGTLIAQPFDPGTYELTGEPKPLAVNVNFWPQRAKGDFSVSTNGLMVYGGKYEEPKGEFLWVDRDGRKTSLFNTIRQGGVRISPDGKKIAYTVDSDGNLDVWVYDIERRSNTRFTFDNSVDIFPTWSRDGSRIYFSSDRKGQFAVYQKPTDGMSNEDSLTGSSGSFVLDVHPDKGILLEVRFAGQGPSTILAYDPKAGKETPLVKGGFRSLNPRFSPDGRWVVYQSDESGSNEIYVIPFMREGSKWQISTGGGAFPLWERSGEIYYVNEGRVMAVKADISKTTPEFSIPREILSFTGEVDTRTVDVSRDGMRFLVYRMGQGERNESLSLISEWPSLVRNN